MKRRGEERCPRLRRRPRPRLQPYPSGCVVVAALPSPRVGGTSSSPLRLLASHLERRRGRRDPCVSSHRVGGLMKRPLIRGD
jgi:hypothetical protein